MEEKHEANSTAEVEVTEEMIDGITEEMIDAGERILLLGWVGSEREAVSCVFAAMLAIMNKTPERAILNT